MLVETCVSFGDGEELNPVEEAVEHPSQALSGRGCRPTRSWVRNRLRAQFAHVYMPRTQPWHPEFPLDWSAPPPPAGQLSRAIFIASRTKLDNPLLTTELPVVHTRQ